MEIRGKKIVVVGSARSGVAAARFLHQRGARVTLTDMARPETLARQIAPLEGMDIELALGGHDTDTFVRSDLIVLSPGVPHTIAPVVAAKKAGIPVMGEVELAFRMMETPIVAITGTNGKTTTTELTGKMLEASGKSVFVGGNIGRPLIDYVENGQGQDVVVAEISSFQTDTMSQFRPKVGVLLNISQDHMDRYPDFQAYGASKARLFSRQTADDTAVYNAGDPMIRQLLRDVKSRSMGFCSHRAEASVQKDAAAVIHEAEIRIKTPQIADWRIDLSRTPLLGRHNHENIAAAGLAAMAAGATPEGVQQALDEFQALPHRLEPVATIDGVRYINDSKGTNMDAVVRALECFDRPPVLIMGGRNKGTDFRPMRSLVREKVKILVAMGEVADELFSIFDGVPAGGVLKAGSMAEAVSMACRSAGPGETVLFSPACASFDMYDNYAARGEDFRKQVLMISGNTSK